MEDKKRLRAPNYSSKEKELLLSLATKYKNTIENKKTDAVSAQDKKLAWFKITQEFNCISPNNCFRPTDSLKKYYENLKEDIRNRAGHQRQSLYKTGGGPVSPKKKVDHDDILLDLVNKKTILGLSNPYDSDAVKEDVRALPELITNVDVSDNEVDMIGTNSNIEVVYANYDKEDGNDKNDENLEDKEDMSPRWSKAADLKKPLHPSLQTNLQQAYTTTSKKSSSTLTKQRNRLTKVRPRSTIKILTSSTLPEKYEILLDKKMELASGLQKEHEHRITILRFDIALRKKDLLAAGYTDFDIALLENPDLLM